MTEGNSDFAQKDSDRVSDIALDEEVDDTNLLFMVHPHQILQNGDFMKTGSLGQLDQLDQELLWLPHCDPFGFSFFNMLKIIGNTLWKLIACQWSQRSQQAGDNKMLQYDRPLTFDDIESQHNIASQEFMDGDGDGDGVYICQENQAKNSIDYGTRMSLRLERDGICVDTAETQHQQETDLSCIRPGVIYSRCLLLSEGGYVDKTSTGEVKDKNLGPYSLIVDIRKVVFHNHPHFLEEEKLMQKLDLLYQKFTCLNDCEVMRNFEIRLGAVIREVVRLKDNCSEYKSNMVDDSDTAAFVTLYHKFLLLTSKMTELEFEAYSLYSKILKTWDEISRVRNSQGFQSTPQSLFKVLREDRTGEDESIIEIVEEFRHCIKWFAKTAKSCSGTSEITTKKLVGNAIETLLMIHSTRKYRVEIVFNKGDESTSLSILSDHAQRKQWQRKRFHSDHYFAKLFVNDEIVDATKAVQIEWSSLEVNFNTRFEVALGNHPENVYIQIYRRKFTRADRPMSTIYIKIPGKKPDFLHSSLDLLSPFIEWYHFNETNQNGNSNQHYIDGSILVATQWKSTNPSVTESYTCRELIKPKCVTFGQKYIGIKQKREINKHNIKKSEGMNNNLIRDMKPSIQASHNNASLHFILKGTRHYFFNSDFLKEPVRHQQMKQRHFDLPSRPNNFGIALEEYCISRDAARRSAYERMQSQIEHDLVETASHERIGVNFKNIKQFVKRFHMSKRFSQSRERPFNVVLENIVHDVSLIRTTMPSTNLLWKCNKLFPSKRRPLFPDIEDLKEGLVGKLRTNQKGHLLISVVGANNVQKREDQFDSKHTPFLMSTSYIKGPSSELPFLSSPNPDSLYRGNTTSAFIRIRFQGKTYHTRIDSGHCPLWEQVIKVPLCFGDDNILTPLKLKRLEEEIEITLFDRVEFDYGKGGGYYSDEETLTGENRFLGFKKVPLEALYQEGKIQGNCILNTPPLILGYEQMSVANTSQISQQELVSRQVLDEIKNDPESQRDEKQMTNCSQPFTSLNLSISVGPSLGCISESRHYYDLPSNECLSTIQYAKDWIDAYINTHCFCAKRYHDILVPAMNGRTWLVNRFLHSQVPPTSCKSSMQRCAHFVSLIPFLNNWISFKTLKQTCNVWSPTQKFLDIMAGNWSEHAVLLANYFMFLSDTGLETPTFDVYLAFGSSITEQRVIYVLTKSLGDGNITLWNPATGQSFSSDDAKCPLVDIGILASSNNIYANIQTVGKPCLLDFQLNCTTSWKLFNDEHAAPTSPIQMNLINDPILIYTDPKELLASELEVDILDRVKSTIRGLRQTPCSFNSNICNQLRHFLNQMEESKRNGTPQILSRDCSSRLSTSSLCRGKHLFGFPLHFGFLNVKEILERIEMTNIHKHNHPDVEFSAAVKVFPYECGAFSVWVFVCTLSPDHFFGS